MVSSFMEGLKARSRYAVAVRDVAEPSFLKLEKDHLRWTLTWNRVFILFINIKSIFLIIKNFFSVNGTSVKFETFVSSNILKRDKNCISWLDLDFWVVKILDLKSKLSKIRLLTLKWKNRCINPTSLKEAYTQNGRNLMGVEKMSKKSWSDFSAKVTWILPVSALFSNDSTFFFFCVCYRNYLLKVSRSVRSVVNRREWDLSLWY